MARPIPPHLIAQLVHPEDAKLSANSHKKVEWSCDNPQHPTWYASVASRTRSGSGCPYCSGRKAVPGVNDLATLYPEYAATLVDPDDAVGLTPRSGKKLRWRCSNNSQHTWEVAPHTRLNSPVDGGCPQCSPSQRWRGNKSKKKRKTVAEEHSELLEQVVEPDVVARLSCGSGKLVSWTCEHGHTYQMAVRKKIAGQACPICRGKQVLCGFNDLATTHPEIAATAVDSDLMYKVSKGSSTVTTWQCEDNPQHQWEAPVYARVAGNGCPQCCEIGTSKLEQKLYVAVKVLDPSAQHRVRKDIDGSTVEFDIVAGTLAIEVNGLYWHSEAIGKPRTYHRDKVRAANKAGYQLIHIWEDQLHMQPGLVLRMIAYKLYALDKYNAACDVFGIADTERAPCGVYNARDLDVVELSNSEAGVFLERNHIQGRALCTHHFALRDDASVVAVLSIRAPHSDGRVARSRDDKQWEIVRFATAGVVRGGFSKLLAYAEKSVDVESWVTFAAHDVSDGGLYKQAGFNVDAELEPDYWYSGGVFRNRRVSKQLGQKRQFRDNDALVYQEGLSEHELALANGMLRIYDAGKTRWVKQVK